MLDQIQFLMDNYPYIKHVISFMVLCRIIFKPAFLILGKYVELTIEKEDDKKLHKFMETKTYKMLVFIVDMLASVKLPIIKKEK